MIFVVEDDPVLRDSVVEYLRHSGHDVEGFADAESAIDAADRSPPDLVISDLQLPGMGGLELMHKLGEIDSAIVRIAVTAHSSARAAVRAIRSGCYEYLEKPVDLAKLGRLLERALTEQRSQRELAWLRRSASAEGALDKIRGHSEAVRILRQQLTAFAQLGADSPPILLLGETGVGKGLAARALHALRFGEKAPWIELNCAAVPASLVEAELFGYEKSAFTDAKHAKPGLFEVAGGGTIFLDEIGEFPLDVQAKLLTVLESRTVRRLGSVRERKVSAAVVAATNLDFRDAGSMSVFRADLYHRLAALTIRIPPLRERGDDVSLLARRFLAEASTRYRKSLTDLSPEAERVIRAHHWPGNVRELRFAIERAVILASDDTSLLSHDTLATLTRDESATPTAHAAHVSDIYADGERIEIALPEGGIPFETLEKAILEAALARTDGNVSQAARFLDMNRDALRYRMRKFGLAKQK